MTDTIDFAQRRIARYGSAHHSVPPDGAGGGGGDMEARVKKLEDDMISLKIDIGVIKATMPTKDDLHAQTTKFIGWLAGVVFALVALMATGFWNLSNKMDSRFAAVEKSIADLRVTVQAISDAVVPKKP